MSYPTFCCEECERLRAEVANLQHDIERAVARNSELLAEIATAETRGWNAAIDAALAILKYGYFAAKIKELKRPEI